MDKANIRSSEIASNAPRTINTVRQLIWNDRRSAGMGGKFGCSAFTKASTSGKRWSYTRVMDFFGDLRDVLQVDASAGLELPLHDVLQNRRVLFEVVFIGRMACQHFIQQSPQPIDVRGGTHAAAPIGDLRGGVGRQVVVFVP